MECAVFTNILTHECTLSHQSSVCEDTDTYLFGCLRYTEKHGKDILISYLAVGVCCCLQTFNLGVNMAVMR